MFLKLFLALAFLATTSSLWANTIDLNLGLRRAAVHDVKWNGTEYGFAYLIDINDELSLGPYLSSTSWKVKNDALPGTSCGDNREFGPELRFVAPLETLNFVAGVSYSLMSKGTARTDDGKAADLSLEGLRFKIGFGLPLAAMDVNLLLVKGVQTVTLESELGKAKADMDDLALALGVSF